MSNPLSLTFQRPTTLSYRDSNGVTQTAPANTPAYEFDTNGVALGSKWTADSVAFSNTAGDYVGQTRGSVRLDFVAPSNTTLVVIDSNVSVGAGYNSMVITYRPNAYQITLNGVAQNVVTGTYSFTNMDRLDIGNMYGASSAAGYFFQRLSTKELD